MRAWLLAIAVLLSACASQEVRVSTPAGQSEQRALGADELAPALASLAQRVVQQVCAAADRIDAAGPDNRVRREALQWRIRASEAAAQAANRDNRIIGMIELWFWTAAMAAHYGPQGAGAAAFAGHQAEVLACCAALAAESERLVRRTVPERGFPALRERILAAAGTGEMFTASAEETRDLLTTLLDVTKIESILSLPLAPFAALKGIGTGGDAVASLVVEARRAIALAERYPQLLAWHSQLAVLGVEEQDTARTVRAELVKLVGIADRLPERLRAEGARLLADAGVDSAMRQAEATARALTGLAAAVDALLARVQGMRAAAEPASAAPARQFDIREYEAALRAAEATAREAHNAIREAANAAAQPQMQVVAAAAAERIERATDRIITRIFVAIGALGAVGAGLIWLYAVLVRRRG